MTAAHDDWTSTELARFSVDACYADLIRETLGGKLPEGWSRFIYPCDDIDEVQAAHLYLTQLAHRVNVDARRVAEHLADLRAQAEADAAEAYDQECGAR